MFCSFLLFIEAEILFSALSREISSVRSSLGAFNLCAIHDCSLPFSSENTKTSSIKILLSFVAMAFVEREFPREIFYRGAMERQERKLSPSSNIGVDLTGRGRLDNNGPDRDAVESNRLGQWRSRLASSESHRSRIAS